MEMQYGFRYSITKPDTLLYKLGVSMNEWVEYGTMYPTSEDAAMKAANFLHDCMVEDTPHYPLVQMFIED
jgi:hypothetical protein